MEFNNQAIKMFYAFEENLYPDIEHLQHSELFEIEKTRDSTFYFLECREHPYQFDCDDYKYYYIYVEDKNEQSMFRKKYGKRFYRFLVDKTRFNVLFYDKLVGKHVVFIDRKPRLQSLILTDCFEINNLECYSKSFLYAKCKDSSFRLVNYHRRAEFYLILLKDENKSSVLNVNYGVSSWNYFVTLIERFDESMLQTYVYIDVCLKLCNNFNDLK